MTLERVPLGTVDARADEVMVPMRDGVRLATDVYLPHGGRRHPAVLVRLPYDKTGSFSFMPSVAARFVDRGFAVVVQDVRGKARSEGEREPWVHEVSDGWATLEWLVSERWSNGAVGMFGDSYYGFTQWAAVASGHPGLKAIVPRMIGSEIARLMYRQGVFSTELVAWAAEVWVDAQMVATPLDWSIRPFADVMPGSLDGLDCPSVHRWATTPPDDPYWTDGIYNGPLPSTTISIPALHVGGWFDLCSDAQLDDYRRSMAAGRAPQHLRMAAVDHFDDPLLDDGEAGVDYAGDEASLASFLPCYVGPAADFFDCYLRGRGAPPPVVRYEVGYGRWADDITWPPPGARSVTLHLAAATCANAGPEGGALADRPDRARRTVRWVHDPEKPVPSLVRDPWRPLLHLPDERENDTRDDVVTFTGPAVEKSMELIGPVVADVGIEVAAPSAHIMVKLLDVFPDGRAQSIVEGAALVGRVSAERRVHVRLRETAYRLRPGHRLRLQIAGAAHPLYIVNPGTEEHPWTARATRPIEMAIAVGGSSGSRLHLALREAP